MTAALTLPAEEHILVTREFAAPAALVYRAWTEPDLIARWWHAGRGEVTEVTADLRVGGTYRQAMVTPDGFEVAFRGEFRELDPPRRIVSTEEYEGAPGVIGVHTITFTEIDPARTRVEMLLTYPSREARDMVIASGMEDGLQDALTLLEGVAQSL